MRRLQSAPSDVCVVIRKKCGRVLMSIDVMSIYIVTQPNQINRRAMSAWDVEEKRRKGDDVTDDSKFKEIRWFVKLYIESSRRSIRTVVARFTRRDRNAFSRLS